MIRTRQIVSLCCLLLFPVLVMASGNSLLIPATGRCVLNVPPEDLSEALNTCQALAVAGDDQAQFELGEYFYTGQYTQQDLQQALHWYEQASLAGHAEAQRRLGTMFFKGEGVPASNIQAFIVLKMSAVNGSEEALDGADEVAEQMSKEELAVATQILGHIFRNYLLELQTMDGDSPFAPLP
jgi:TPR repeat protein